MIDSVEASTASNIFSYANDSVSGLLGASIDNYMYNLIVSSFQFDVFITQI